MFGNKKTDYIFSSVDTPRGGDEDVRGAIEVFRNAVRVLSGPAGIENPIVSEAAVVPAVNAYLSEPKFSRFSVEKECEIHIGNDTYRADLGLFETPGHYIAIAECGLPRGSNYAPESLRSYLSAAKAQFGIIASGINRDLWRFYENLPDNQFRQIERVDFEKGILEFQILRDDEGDLEM